MESTGKVIGAVMLGAAIGGCLGVLFAPDKGSETRRKIAQGSCDLTDSMKDKFTSLIEDIKAELTWAKEKSKDVVEKGATNVTKNA